MKMDDIAPGQNGYICALQVARAIGAGLETTLHVDIEF
jgi:hypothetical protein